MKGFPIVFAAAVLLAAGFAATPAA